MSDGLSLKLLGGFAGSIGQEPLPPLPRKSQALLAFLALEGRALHARTELAALFWGDTGGEQGQQSLRKALSVLRQAFAGRANFLLIQEGAVGLDRSSTTVDAIEFERLARDRNDASLAQAAALYRGPLLAGLDLDGEGPFGEWLLARRERLRELAVATLSRLLDRQIADGSLDEAVDTASRVFEIEPLHEPAHRALILIYGRQGRRAAAARQYQLCAELLERELGVKPDPATIAAYRESLEAESIAARNTPPNGTPRSVEAADEVEAELPAAEATTRGKAGVATWKGRTAAGLAAAALVAATFALPALNSRRGAPAEPPVRRSVAVLAMKNLSGQAEHSWLQTALTETIGAELMVGGRFRLVSAESVIRMQLSHAPPTGVGLTRKQLDEIGRDLGCDLILSGDYLAVGGKVRVDVRLDDVATGERLASASETDEEGDLLALVDRAGDELREALHLAPPERGERDAIRALVPAATSRRAYYSGLAALRDRDGPRAAALLQEAVAADPGFALAHASLSAAWRLLGYDKRGAEEARKALDLASRLRPEDRMNVEAHFHEATFDWARAVDAFGRLWHDYPDNIEYGLKLANVLQIATRLKEAQEVVDQMRRLRPPDNVDPRIDLVDATVAERLGDFKRALAGANRAAEKAQATNATLLLARARVKQGIYLSRQASPAGALERFAESRALFESLGERGGVADALRWEGATLVELGRLDEAAPKLQGALEIARPLNYVRLTTEILLYQAAMERQRGALAAARASAEAAVASAREADEQSAIARTSIALGVVLKVQGDYTRARAVYRESEAILQRLGDKAGGESATNNLASLDLAQGRTADAVAALEPLLAQARTAGNKTRLAVRLLNLSLARSLQGRLGEAEVLNLEECRLNEELGARPNLASCRVRLALIRTSLGRVEEARASIADIVVKDLHSTPQPSLDLSRLALLHLAVGDREAAARMVAGAESVLKGREYIPEQAIPVEITRARIEASESRKPAAVDRLERAAREADRFGLLPLSLEARFAAASLRADSSRVEAIRREAVEAGLAGVLRNDRRAHSPFTSPALPSSRVVASDRRRIRNQPSTGVHE